MITFSKRPGDKIKFLVPNGIGREGVEWKAKSGKVVMVFPTHVVVNGGGKYGTPHVVDDNNFIS
jgi:hypothetical protein